MEVLNQPDDKGYDDMIAYYKRMFRCVSSNIPLWKNYCVGNQVFDNQGGSFGIVYLRLCSNYNLHSFLWLYTHPVRNNMDRGNVIVGDACLLQLS